MESQSATVNLARRLRPQTFSQIIGQDVPVRMLKNSLSLNKFFPVYLFFGQRGCGKTSTARVFAAAINCDQFVAFQKNPTQQDIPCLTCGSCVAMQRGAHPDFIEIDAASNTGVDNVRQLIETAAYVPLQGRKKVYLIDEAHMLSKAAFNALLKILEEPPMSVLFMLATTELHKVPQTVLSRCFQLSFPALEQQAFTGYLREVCARENIVIEDAALNVLIEETDGSARDALNMLEQVRFVESPISEASIRKILGKLSISVLLDLLEAIASNRPDQVIAIFQTGSLQGTSPQATWDLLVQAVKNLLWLKYTKVDLPSEFAQYQERCVELAAALSHNRLIAAMQLLWDQERIFLQTAKKQAFLEFLFIQLAEQDNIVSIDELLRGVASDAPAVRSARELAPARRHVESASVTQRIEVAAKDFGREALPGAVAPIQKQSEGTDTVAAVTTSDPVAVVPEPWAMVLSALRTQSQDAILLAILEQAHYTQPSEQEIIILLRNNTKFFTDKLEEMRSTWFPLLQEMVPGVKTIKFGQRENVPVAPPRAQPVSAMPMEHPRPQVTQVATSGNFKSQKTFKQASPGPAMYPEGEFVSPSLPFASLLTSHFPGKLKKLKIIN